MKAPSGGMSCRVITNSYTEQFYFPETGTIASAIINSFRAFTSSAFPGCTVGMTGGEPFAHNAVSLLTVSSTTHIGQATVAASPLPTPQSPTISATQSAPRSSMSPLLPSPAIPPSSTSPQLADLTHSQPSNMNPPQSQSANPTPQTTNSAPLQFMNPAPAQSANLAPPLSPAQPLQPQPRPTSMVYGASTQAIAPAAAATSVVIAGATMTPNAAGQYIVGSQTLVPGSSITVSGQAISLAPSGTAIVSGPSTVSRDAPSDVVAAKPPVLTIGNSVVTAGPSSDPSITDQARHPGSPAVTVSGTEINLASSATQVVVGSNTIFLDATGASSRVSLPALPIGGQMISANSRSQYMIGPQTLFPGGVITVSGTSISLASDASELVIGGTRTPLSVPGTSATLVPPAVDGKPITANSASNFIIDSQTLTPGGVITVSGTPISLAPKASQVVIGSSTIPLIPSSTVTPGPSAITGQTITANSQSQYISGSQTLTPSGAITVSGTRASLSPSAFQGGIDNSTIQLSINSTSSAELGDLMMKPFGGTPVGSPSATNTNQTSAALFIGAAPIRHISWGCIFEVVAGFVVWDFL